jgi:hypothetical protein
MAGRRAIADQVRHVRSLGIDAAGWLSSSKSADAIAEYAEHDRADLILLPSDLEDPGLTGRLRGEASVDEVDERALPRVGVVDRAGHVQYR